jgi:hypothetical protein
VTGLEASRGESGREPEARPPALSASVVAALADSGLTEADYVSRFSADGVWYGDACGCSDDRCAGFHHDEASDCGCFPNLLEQAMDELDLEARSSVEDGEAEAYLAVADEQQAWQVPDELSADATAEHAAELGPEWGEVEL